MTAPVWTSILLGVALGAANAAAAMLLVRAARGRSQGTFMTIVFGGMVARMTALLAAVAAVVAWAPIDRSVFVIALGAAVAMGLLAEILLVSRLGRIAHA